MQSQKLKVGIVGCGVIAPFHLKAFRSLEGVEVLGLADVNEARAIELCEQYDVPFHYSDYKKLLEEDIDVVSICTPSGLHYEIAINALNKGKHVIVEKPMAINLSQADEMITVSKKTGVKLAAIFDHRFDAASVKIKESLDEGRFGRLIIGNAGVKWYRTEQYYGNKWRGTWDMDGGGILANQAIHWIDLLQWFMGPVIRVYGKIKKMVHDIEAADTSVALIEFKSGALGVLEASTAIYPGEKGDGVVYDSLPERVEIYGQDGSVVLEKSKDFIIWEFKDRNKLGLEINKNQLENTGHTDEIREIIKAIREEREVPINGEEARKALEIIRAIYYSSFTETPVDIPFDRAKDTELDKLILKSKKS